MMTHVLHPDHLQPGHRVGAWRIVASLGTGGTSRVFKVEREGQFFALKMALRPLSLDETHGQRLEETCWRMAREVAALLTYSPHPNLLRVYAVDCWPHPTQGYLFFVTDYVEGDDWHAWRWRAPPHAAKLVDTFSDVVRTVGVLHSRGVYHRDLKADNILIRREDGRPFLIDFGNVKLPGAITVTLGLPPGVVHLLPPEVLAYTRSEAWKQNVPFRGGVAADLYALGVLLYQGLTDRHPFDPELPDKTLVAAIAEVVPEAPSVLNPRAPRSLSDIALKLLEKRPEDRYSNTEALLQALATAEQERTSPDWQVPLYSIEEDLAEPVSPAVETPPAPLPEATAGSPVAPPTEEQSTQGAEPRDKSTTPHRTRHTRWLLALFTGLFMTALILWLAHPTLAPPTEEPSAVPVPTEKGTPPMNSPPHDAVTPAQRPGLLAAWLCALVGLGCPAVQVKPPESSDCPTETLQVMANELKLVRGHQSWIVLDPNQPPDKTLGLFRDGPLVSRVYTTLFGNPLPEGTLLYGQLWSGPGIYKLYPDGTKTDSVLARYTSIVLPDGRKYPVCIVLGDADGRLEKDDGPTQGGVTVLPRRFVVTVVQRWP